MTLLLSYMGGIAKDCEPPSMAWFMKKPKPTMFCRKFSFRSGKKPVVIRLRPANHSAGWSPLRGGVPSTGCDGARLILARESAMKDEWFRNHRLLAATPLRVLC